MQPSKKFPGFQTQDLVVGPGVGEATSPLLVPPWISAHLLADTQKTWSLAYGRVVAAPEAVEILVNVRRLAEILLKVHRKERNP